MKKKFKSVRPKVDVTNQCHRCEKFYEDKNIALLKEGVVCLNCLDTKNPEDVNKMLKAGFRQEKVLAIQHIQYD